MTFAKLQIIEPIQRALAVEGYEIPTPIQTQAIPILLAGGDVLGSAQTGTGKTAAFAIPILQNLTQTTSVGGPRLIQALVLTPTRELALQIKDSFIAYGKFMKHRTVVIFGGVPQRPQQAALRAGVDILVATPGRLLDLMNQKIVDLSHIRFFVLDEADRMLDMGFINDVKKVIAVLPKRRQTMLFSATMPEEIAKLSASILINPTRIAVVPVETTIDAINQAIYFVSKKNKINLLIELLNDKRITSALVFSRTKHGANRIVKDLGLAHVDADAIHGNKSQGARQAALFKFKNKQMRVLVATDIAARGLDIDQLSHVINFDLPEVPETYIHRIGRTGRAGLEGAAISFCAEEELGLLNDIQKHIKKIIPVVKNHPYAVIYIDAPTTLTAKITVKKPAPKPMVPKNFSPHDTKSNHHHNSRKARQ
ncbi:MAG: DEAD/DEAH box helicase [Candidatus Izemoplasmatales bacterium]|jgi:ATP-dependent RNA helicase RhlE|nr:DEAD/DEAH box helicase [Candidatus Izemoplasmatales bacterium]